MTYYHTNCNSAFFYASHDYKWRLHFNIMLWTWSLNIFWLIWYIYECAVGESLSVIMKISSLIDYLKTHTLFLFFRGSSLQMLKRNLSWQTGQLWIKRGWRCVSKNWYVKSFLGFCLQCATYCVCALHLSCKLTVRNLVWHAFSCEFYLAWIIHQLSFGVVVVVLLTECLFWWLVPAAPPACYK